MTRADDFPSSTAFITQPPPDLAGWVAALDPLDIPVLAATDAVLDELRCIEDAVDAHGLADRMAADPLMTLKLLRHVAVVRAGRGDTDAETATEALVMLGITPFFRDFGPQATVEQRLAGLPAALAGLQQVLRRSHRAARFALGFAIHRQDYDAPLIHEAALLHDFADLLLWAHAPALALAIAQRQQAQPGQRSTEAQQAVLKITLSDLQQALMKAWRLPPLLVQISCDQDSPLTQVRNVQLAVRVARHSAQGWHNPALPDDIAALAKLLDLGPEHALELLHELDS